MSPATALRLACIDAAAPPLFSSFASARGREGFEPALGEALGAQLERPIEWRSFAWPELIPAVQSGEADAILCGQGITADRRQHVDFTTPYAIFHESVLVRRGSGIGTVADLVGRKVAAIENSTNMALAQTFTGAVPVPFGTGDVYGDMLEALARDDVDAVVDDDVVLVPLGESDPRFQLAFTVKTGNRWGIAVARDRKELLAQLDRALADTIADGRHREIWNQWLPSLEYPFLGRS